MEVIFNLEVMNKNFIRFLTLPDRLFLEVEDDLFRQEMDLNSNPVHRYFCILVSF